LTDQYGFMHIEKVAKTDLYILFPLNAFQLKCVIDI